MIAELGPYSNRRDSDIRWVSGLPEHWQARRLRTLSRTRIENGVGESAQEFRPDLPRYIRITDIAGPSRLRDDTRASLPAELAQEATVQRGDLLLAAVGATYGKSYVHLDDERPACFAGYLVRVSPNEAVLPAFLSYWTQSRHYWDQVNSCVIQSTIQNYSAARYKRLIVPVPPVAEQGHIVHFLDHAGRRFRRAILAKQKLIALLNEEKQAVIYRAVTRGLDPGARLRTSGVDWLDDVPEHWSAARIHSLFRERVQTGRPELPILAVTINRGVESTSETDGDGRPRKLLEDRGQYKVAATGDIAYNTMRMWQGAVGVVPQDGLVSPAYVVCAPRNGTNSDYYAMLFRTDVCKGAIITRSRGIADDRNRLYWDAFKTLRVPVPPHDEQAQIVAALAEETATATKSIVSANREIELLREYRTSLITGTVTGTLDVREAAKQLPEEDGEPGPLDDVVLDDAGDIDAEAREPVEA